MRLTPDLLDGLLRAPAPRPKLPPSRERAAMNRHRVLCAVAEHGSLRCTDLAAACWPGARYGLQMAQRAVRLLVQAGHLKTRPNALGGQSFVLTRPGAAELELRGIDAHHGLDLAVSGHTYRHAALTARWCIAKRAEGFQTHTEYAIAAGRAPLGRELLFRRLGRHVDAVLVQTQAIHARQRQRRTLDGLLGRERKQAVLPVHRNAQRLLKPLAVVNPWADRLTFLDDRTRTRRDHEKYLGLIDTIALLHQHQRPVRTATAQGQTIEYIEATLDDIAQANALAHEVLGRSLDELPPQTRKLLAELVRWVGERAKAQGLPRAEVRFSRRELREALAWGDTQLKVHLVRLVELELVTAHRLPGGALAYELRYDGDGSATPHLSGLIDVQALRGGSGYDGERSGVNGARSVAGRALVGAGSAPGRNGQPAAGPGVERPGDVLVDAGLAARVGVVAARRSHAAPA